MESSSLHEAEGAQAGSLSFDAHGLDQHVIQKNSTEFASHH